jgi:acetylornithine deacetylase
MMVRVIDAIESRYIPSVKASHPMVGPAACSINLIQGGKQINVIPDQCEISVDRRLSPGEDHSIIQPEFEKLLDELRGADPLLKVTQGEPFFDPPLDPAPNEAFCGFVQKVLTDMSLPIEPVGVKYGTDASQFSEIGIPAVVIGPGSIDQAHTKDEWLELDQLDRCVELYLNLMREPAR